MLADTHCVYVPGPWEHVDVPAGGAQFHAAVAGTHTLDRPLVVLLHGFPEFWWTWRHHIPALAADGWQVAAVDLRGCGGSDKTPQGYVTASLAADIAAVIRALGYDQAIVIGHGVGGAVAWTLPQIAPQLIRGIIPISSPHPLGLRRISLSLTAHAWRWGLAVSIPRPLKRTLLNPEWVTGLLRDWSATPSIPASAPTTAATTDATDDDAFSIGPLPEAELYIKALQLPRAARCARSIFSAAYNPRRRGQDELGAGTARLPIEVPVLTIRGELDPLLPERAFNEDRRHCTGSYLRTTVPEAGHFVHEEQPEHTIAIIRDHLHYLLRKS